MYKHTHAQRYMETKYAHILALTYTYTNELPRLPQL